jgi:hypothetical protein
VFFNQPCDATGSEKLFKNGDLVGGHAAGDNESAGLGYAVLAENVIEAHVCELLREKTKGKSR